MESNCWNDTNGDFPGSPVVRTPCFHCRGHKFNPWSRSGILCMCLAAQLCLTHCDPVDCSPPGSSVLGILQARILEWIAMPSSKGSSQPRDQTQVSRIAGRFFTDWATKEAQEYWNGQPIPLPGDVPNPGIEPGSPSLQADSLPASWSTRKAHAAQPKKKKRYKWTYLQIKNRLRDLKIKLVVTKGETWGEVIN